MKENETRSPDIRIRNQEIIRKYHCGMSIRKISGTYFLSRGAIHNIIRISQEERRSDFKKTDEGDCK